MHAIMGPMVLEKAPWASCCPGRPGYEATVGTITFKGQNLLELDTEERAREGLFLAFRQYLR